jgi:hypothetical protein
MFDNNTETMTNTYKKKMNNTKYVKHKLDMKNKRRRAEWFKDGRTEMLLGTRTATRTHILLTLSSPTRSRTLDHAT